MAELLPQDNGTFRVVGFSESIRKLDEFAGDISKVCQMRLNIVGEMMELLGDNEVELDMADKSTASVVRIMAMSAMDHFMICDFDMSISISEIVLEFDPEDHYAVVDTLIYSYAMSSDKEAVMQLLPFSNISDTEKELVIAIADFQTGNQHPIIPNEIKLELADAESDLFKRTEHLWLEIPKFKELLRI